MVVTSSYGMMYNRIPALPVVHGDEKMTYAGAPTRPVPTSISPLGSEPTYSKSYQIKATCGSEPRFLRTQTRANEKWTYISGPFVMRDHLLVVASSNIDSRRSEQ